MFAYKGSFEFDWITHRQFDRQPIFCGEKNLRRTWYQQRLRAEIKLYMLFAGWEVRIVKNCDRELENAEELDNNDIGRAFEKSNGFRFKTV